MLIDSRNLENGTLIEGDICIIGAGAAGISIALEWMNTPYKVILLEGGGMEYEDRTQELIGGKLTGRNYYPVKSTRLHYFGGSTGHWGGYCALFDPIAFRQRSWVPLSGWPINQDDLIPFYKRANSILDLEEYEFDVDKWMLKDATLKKMPIDKSVFWHKVWRFSPPTRFGSKYAKTITEAKNIHLYTYAHAVNIATDEKVQQVTEVEIKNFAGKTHKVKAKHFIMACCSLQNARLLLHSNKQAPNGLGNDHDNVGRYFMEHAELKSAELWLKDKFPFTVYTGYNYKFRAELAVTPEMQEKLNILNGIMSFVPLYSARKVPSYIESWKDDDPRANEARMKEKYKNAEEDRLTHAFKSWKPEAYQVVMRLEQQPNPDSRVILDKESLDELGTPKIKLNWVLGAAEKRSARKIYELLGQQVGQAGLGRIRLLHNMPDEKDDQMPDTTSAGWHHMGTTRMSVDPKTGVVDANCKVHGINNLFVASSSCFTTGGGVNPTMTIVALSLRVSDHVKKLM